MNNVNSQDYILYKKCKQRVIKRILLTFIFLILYSIGVYMGLNTSFLQVDSNGFSVLLATTLLVQLCIYSILFLFLASGSKIYRFLYWLAFILSISLIYVPANTMISDTGHLLSYIILILFMLIKLYVLYHFGKYLKNNPSAKVLFDHVIEVNAYGEYEDKRFAKDIQKAQKKLNKKPPVLPNMQTPIDDEIPVEEVNYVAGDEVIVPTNPYEGLTYKKLSIRLGIIVYVSLGLFPIIVQVFHSLFASNDYEHIFANQDMFVACLVSAVVWTVPILFLYFNHHKSLLVVKLCFVAEFARIAIYLPTFISYIRAEDVTYPIRTFIFFVLLDIIRYIFLFTSIKPVFKLDIPEPINDDDEYD